MRTWSRSGPSISTAGFDFYFGLDEYPDESELDSEPAEDEKTVARLVFPDYKTYARHEIEIKDFADSVGASVTIGK